MANKDTMRVPCGLMTDVAEYYYNMGYNAAIEDAISRHWQDPDASHVTFATRLARMKKLDLQSTESLPIEKLMFSTLCTMRNSLSGLKKDRHGMVTQHYGQAFLDHIEDVIRKYKKERKI